VLILVTEVFAIQMQLVYVYIYPLSFGVVVGPRQHCGERAQKKGKKRNYENSNNNPPCKSSKKIL